MSTKKIQIIGSLNTPEFDTLKQQVNTISDLVGDDSVAVQIDNAVSNKSQVQIITWEVDD